MRMMMVLAVGLSVLAGSAGAQEAPVAAAQTVRAAEVPVDGLVRKDTYAVAWTVPGKVVGPGVDAGPDVVVEDFEFNGEPVPTSKLHFKQLSAGVVEITSVAYSVGVLAVSGARCGELLRAGRAVRYAGPCAYGGEESSQDNGHARGRRRISRFRFL